MSIESLKCFSRVPLLHFAIPASSECPFLTLLNKRYLNIPEREKHKEDRMATVDIGAPLLDKIKAFRLAKHSKGNLAVVIKIDKAKLEMDIEDELNNVELNELKEGKKSTQLAL